MTFSPDPQGLALEWVTDPSRLPELAQDWRILAEEVDADIFARPEWLTVWWARFGASRRLACMVARQNGVLVGVLPFAIERIWLGPIPFRVARIAGTDPNYLVLQPAVRNDWLDTLLQAAMTYLLGAESCLAVSFTPVSELSAFLKSLQSIASADPALSLLDEAAGTHVVFDLPDSFETYLNQLSRNRRSQFRRRLKSLEQTFGAKRECVFPDAAGVDAFADFHAQQWEAVGRGGHFSDWPGSAAVYRDLAELTAATGVVQIDRLTGNIGELAAEFSVVAGRTAHWRLPARLLDPEVERLGAGKVVFLLMFERFIANGVTRIEGGRGKYDYKLDYGGRDVPVRRQIVTRASAWSRLRLKALLAWADLIHLLYYRIWFLKLAPRLRQKIGGRPRPLWRLWIRTRL